MSEAIYLDQQNGTKPFAESVTILTQSLLEYFADPTAPHFLGQQQRALWERGQKQLKSHLGAHEEDLLFLQAGVREVFLHAYLEVSRQTGKTLFLVADEEGKSDLALQEEMRSLGCVVKKIPLNARGQVTKEALASCLTAKTALVSLPWAQGLTGVLQPIVELASLCREKGVLLLVDASYVLGRREFPFRDVGVDFLTIEGGLIHAPRETKCLLVRKGAFTGKVPSVESLPFLLAFSHSVWEMKDKLEHYCMEVARLRDLLEGEVVEGFPSAKVLLTEADRLPDRTVIAFPGVEAESLLYLLNHQGVYASMGGGRFPFLKELLPSLGEEKELAITALSFSLAYDQEEEEIRRAARLIVACARQLKALSGGEGI